LGPVIVWKPAELSHNSVDAGCEAALQRLRNFIFFQFGNRTRHMIGIEKKPMFKDAKDLQSLASMLAPQF